MTKYITFSIIILSMYSEELIVLAMQILVACALGLVGSTFRILLQYRRDGKLPEDGLDLKIESILGVGAGFLSWLFVAPEDLRSIAIVAITAGYTASDAIENWLGKK